ncbi:MAG: cupin domain-containing protein [Gloeomargaritaceae cyanobacterium C42_A2020_066]|nr:cupin domain-containing protein [Gloeomargaritaceae cyanobacterium C42_A2020_066]
MDRVWQTLGRPGVEIAYLYRDEARREMTCLLRLTPGASLPHHRHADCEEIFMLEGDLECDGQVFQAGDYLRSAPHTDHMPSSCQGCVAYVRTSPDNEFLPGLALH